jgi:group I intron endonuclease
MESLYKIENKITGRIYIGATCDFNTRKREHLRELRKNKHKNPLMQNDFNKYGIDSFMFEVILESDDCFSIEQEYISSMGTYNIAKGGVGGDVFNQLSTDRQDKIRLMVSDRNKKRFKDPEERRKCNAFPDWLSEEEKSERLKVWSECKKGPNNGRFKHNKRVAQIDKKTNKVIKVWPYARMLQDYGFNPKYIINCCNGTAGYASHKDFIWRWA